MNKYFIGNVTLCLLWENDGETIFIDSLNGFSTAEKIEKISEGLLGLIMLPIGEPQG